MEVRLKCHWHHLLCKRIEIVVSIYTINTYVYTCSQNQVALPINIIQVHVPSISEESVRVIIAVAVVAEVLEPVCPGAVTAVAVCINH